MRQFKGSTSLLSALTGAGSGLLVVWAASGDAAPSEAGEVAVTERQDAQSTPSPIPDVREFQATFDEGRLGRLEERLAAMEQRADDSAATRSEDDFEPDEPSEQETVQELEAKFDRMEEKFSSEGRDPGWSDESTGRLQDDLLALSEERGFAVEDVECKTTRCRARLSWNDYSAALEDTRLYERQYGGLNCTRTVWFRTPADVNAPYSTSLFLDCSELRAGLADPLPGTHKGESR